MHFHKLVAHIQLQDSFSEVLKLLSSELLKLLSSELVTQYFSAKTPVGPFCRCCSKNPGRAGALLQSYLSTALQLFSIFFSAREDCPGLLSLVQNLTHCSHSH